jgi:hypothetical protein
MMKFYFIAVLCIAGNTLCAQRTKKDTTAIDHQKYRNEIGVQVQPVWPFISTGRLMFKKRINNNKATTTTYFDNLRLSAEVGGFFSRTKEDSLMLNDANNVITFYNTGNLDASNQHFSGSVGKERVHIHGRFNVFYGIDLGMDFFHDKRIFTIYNDGVNIVPIFAKRNSISLRVSPFIGVKYRFSNRVSISAEAAFILKYTLLHQRFKEKENARNTNNPFDSRFVTHTLDNQFNALNLLTLNYHFKQ